MLKKFKKANRLRDPKESATLLLVVLFLGRALFYILKIDFR